MPSRSSVQCIDIADRKRTAGAVDKPVFINAILPRKRAFYQKKYDQSVLAILSLQCPDFHLSVAGQATLAICINPEAETDTIHDCPEDLQYAGA